MRSYMEIRLLRHKSFPFPVSCAYMFVPAACSICSRHRRTWFCFFCRVSVTKCEKRRKARRTSCLFCAAVKHCFIRLLNFELKRKTHIIPPQLIRDPRLSTTKPNRAHNSRRKRKPFAVPRRNNPRFGANLRRILHRKIRKLHRRSTIRLTTA
jgi:hypothetical protein